jgi:hypothetical protein
MCLGILEIRVPGVGASEIYVIFIWLTIEEIGFIDDCRDRRIGGG